MDQPVTESKRNDNPGGVLRASFQGGIFVILSFAALRYGKEIFLPVAAALLLTFVLQPLQRAFQRAHVPRYLSAFIILALLVGAMAGFSSALAPPATAWVEQIPESVPELKDKFKFLSKPVERTQQIMKQAEDITKGAGPAPTPVAIQGTRLADRIINGTGAALGGIVTTLLLMFFMLATGDVLLRRFVEVMPKFEKKRQVVDIFQQIEADVSRYLVTITAMNACIGLAAGAIMWAFGIRDPVLWALLAFLLNYVPIIGPICTAGVFCIVGFIEIESFWRAVAPAALYLCAHITESGILTPRILARQFTINPLLVILSLVFWYWMWGFAGALLAVPMLVILRIVSSRVEGLKAFGHVLEG